MPERYGNEVKMLEIIRIERKRILSIRAFLVLIMTENPSGICLMKILVIFI